MHVLVEVHHLEAIELIRYRLNLLFLINWDSFDVWCIPFDVSTRGLFASPTSLDCPTGNFTIMNVLNSMIPKWACVDLCSVHLE
jgi:hypothetical protein